MHSVVLSLKILRGALLGAVAAVVLYSISWILQGWFENGSQGLFLGFAGAGYYVISNALQVGPIGAVIGAAWVTTRLIFTRKWKSRLSAVADISLAVVLVALILALARLPYAVTNVQETVSFGSTYQVISTTSPGDVFEFESYLEECPVDIVVLPATAFASAQVVCSAYVLEYLESHQGETVTVEWIETSDFGEVRGRRLDRIGDVQIWATDWLGPI